MNKLYIFVLLTVLAFVGTEGALAKPHYNASQKYLCDAAAAQMAQYPDRAAQVCEGYPGCRYIAPQKVGGDCVARDPRTRHQVQPLCNAAAAMAANTPEQLPRICEGFPGCEYIEPSWSSYIGKCVPR
ncbi:hypothetical protein ACLVWU_11690 [Bdellovibrio sp. HCB290]|uniref:hypothetical protein n=1 Tax=Bdellovibrio sp. HCB290 TaxID=3394356 RepID=UPI0039B38019